MTNEERKEIVAALYRHELRITEGINELCGTAAAQIEADGNHIAELESWKAAEEAHHHFLTRRIDELEGALRDLLHAESRFAQAVRVATGSTYSPSILDIAEKRARAALGETK